MVESRILLMEHKYPSPLFLFFLVLCLFYARNREKNVKLRDVSERYGYID